MAMLNNQRVHEITSWMVGTNSVPQKCPSHQLKSPSFGCHMWPCRQRNTCQNRRISWSEFHLEYKQTAWWQHFSWLNLLKKETNNSDQLVFYGIISIPTVGYGAMGWPPFGPGWFCATWKPPTRGLCISRRLDRRGAPQMVTVEVAKSIAHSAGRVTDLKILSKKIQRLGWDSGAVL